MDLPSSSHTETSDSRGERPIDFILGLSPFERLLITVLAASTLVSGVLLFYRINNTTLVETPRSGGSYVEGITGTPRFINPLLAISDADKDLTKLVYAGLMTRNEQGELVPELAESVHVSDDGKVYTFVLKEGLQFHDGTPLTADDVVFTVETASNPALLSPVFANWDNAKVEKKDDRTVVFTLPEPYSPFLANTTLGILPKHIWEGVATEQYRFSTFNVNPVGAGPYKVTALVSDKSGIPASYELAPFDAYALGAPHIATLTFKLFDNKSDALTALLAGTVDAVGGVPYAELSNLMGTPAAENLSIRRVPLLRTFAVFFNHNRQPLLLRKEVREALDMATPKEAVVGEALAGYGTVLAGPLPPFMLGDTTTATGTPIEGQQPRVERARDILEKAGWKLNESSGVYEREIDKQTKQLTITLAVLDLPELTTVANRIADSWRAAGFKVDISVFNSTDLVQTVVRPRKYDALLYGMVIGHELDLYAFWHSSQRNDPGLNIAQYADIEADKLLERMRTELDPGEREELYRSFNDLAAAQHAAIFLYMPDYVYVVRTTVRNITLHPLGEPSERFDTIHAWYIDTDRVWPFLTKFLR